MLTAGGMGFSLNPLRAVKKVASGAEHLAVKSVTVPTKFAVKAGKEVGKGAVFVVKKTVLLPTEFAIEITKAATRLALRPVTSRIKTLENRRANKIAWDARKSKTPTPAERAQAKSWTKSKLNHELPHGPLLALLAGAPPVSAAQLGSFGMATNLGIAPAVIAALIPVFMALMNAMLSKLSKSGEAPVAIGPNGQPIIPPGMDPTMPDPAAQAAVDAGADGPGGPDGGPGGPSGPADGMIPGGHGDVMVPGGPVKKSNVMLFAGVAAAIVIVAVLMKPSGSKPAAKK